MGLTESLVAAVHVTPPEEARVMMCLSTFDWAACGIAGQASGDFNTFTKAQPVDGACTTFTGGDRSPATAALINGTLSHALDYDDTHFDHIGHPSVAILPAALAVGETVGASLSEIIDAALIGAEASVAVGLWLGREHYEKGYHQTATAGSFGATLAAARLLKLEPAALRQALGLTSTMASGLKSQFGTMGKPLNAGLAARTGVEAAFWAQAGVTSAADGLAGAQGFGPTHHGAADTVVFPHAPWRMCRVSHKLHACCHGLHAALNAVADIELRNAKEVTVYTHPRWLSVCNIAAPESGLACKFSYAQVLAMRAYGIATNDIGSFSDAVARRPELVAFRERVQVEGNGDLSEWQAIVDIDGARVQADLEQPIDIHVLTGKLKDKANALAGPHADDVWHAIGNNDLGLFQRAVSAAGHS